MIVGYADLESCKWQLLSLGFLWAKITSLTSSNVMSRGSVMRKHLILRCCLNSWRRAEDGKIIRNFLHRRLKDRLPFTSYLYSIYFKNKYNTMFDIYSKICQSCVFVWRKVRVESAWKTETEWARIKPCIVAVRLQRLVSIASSVSVLSTATVFQKRFSLAYCIVYSLIEMRLRCMKQSCRHHI